MKKPIDLKYTIAGVISIHYMRKFKKNNVYHRKTMENGRVLRKLSKAHPSTGNNVVGYVSLLRLTPSAGFAVY